jgi:2-oxoglutarate dehydrogenase E1 component
MTPKSLLRHPAAVSQLDDFLEGHFQRVLSDTGRVGETPIDPARVDRILLCSGKVYYDLEQRRLEQERTDVAILRLEQFTPLAEDDLRHALDPYPARVPIFWVQEEPRNMGAWPFLQTLGALHARVLGEHRFYGVTRRASPVPATGSGAAHRIEQKELLDQAFAPLRTS